MSERDQALEEISRLVRVHDLSQVDLLRILENPSTGKSSGIVPRVLGYIGGLFLFSGVAAFIAINWDSFPSSARVLVTLGVGLAVFAGAVLIQRGQQWLIVVTPAYLAAEVLQPTGMLVAFDEYGGGGDAQVAFAITGAVLCVQAIVAYRLAANSVLVFAALLFGTIAVANVFDLAGIDEGLNSVVVGASVTLLALGLDRMRYPWIVNAWTGAGSVAVYLGAFDLLAGQTLEVTFALIAGGGIYVSVLTRARSILVSSVLALLTYISYFTLENFSDSLGWPLALMIIGLAFVGLGRLALQFNRRYFG